MTKIVWSPNESLIVPLPKITFLMNNDNSGRCQMHQVGIPEYEIIKWAKQFGNKEKRFIDCGAHMGTYSLLLADEFKHVEAFEAQRRTYLQLCGNIFIFDKENVSPYHAAVTDKEGADDIVELFIVSEDGGGSTILPVPEDQTVLAKEYIDTCYLDNFEWQDVGLLKIDVEGNELAVLRGAEETIIASDYPPIIFEANSHAWYVKHKKNLFDYLIVEFGYSIGEIKPFNNMFIAVKK
jgi:FkbM family methyltransferase